MTNDNDKILSFDFHYAVCLLAADELIEALDGLFAASWLLTSGDDIAADKHYRRSYHSLLRYIADEAYPLIATDEFRTQYETQDYGRQD